MNEALADLFAMVQNPRILWDGEMAYAIYEIAPAPSSLTVEFINAINIPTQGLAIKIEGGILKVNGAEAMEIHLWRDTAPDSVTVQVKQEIGVKSILKLWNIWRGSMAGVSVTQAWLGNAGMRIERSEGGKEFFLCCSDGEGPVDFSNLEVRVTLF